MEVGMPQVVMTQQFYSRNEHRSLGGKTNVSSAKGIAVIGAVLCLSSCWIRPIPPHFEPGPHRAPPTSVDNVRVVNLSGENWAEQLPEGLYAGNSNQYIMAADDYPTRETPHRILGTVIGVNISKSVPTETLVQMREIAAAQGANTLLILHPEQPIYSTRYNGARTAGVAVLLSTDPPNVWQDAHSLLVDSPPQFEGYQKMDQPIQFELESQPRFEISGVRGLCYGVVMAIDHDASFSPVVRRRGLRLRVRRYEEIVSIVGRWRGDSYRERRHAFKLGCPQNDGPIKVELRHTNKELSRFGKGKILAQLYTKQIDEDDLRLQAERDEAAYQANEQFAADRDCELCRRHIDLCWRFSPTMRPTECSEFVHCMSRTTSNASQCRFF